MVENVITLEHQNILNILIQYYIFHILFLLTLICRSGASLLRTTDCASQKQRRWPEDVAWHPDVNSVFSVYNADSQDSQISVTDFSKVKGGEVRYDSCVKYAGVQITV